MARWRLVEAHYLNTPGTEWEYTETSQQTGRPIRHRFPVPTLLDPKDADCWNYVEIGPTGRPIGGDVIVSDGSNPQPKDIIFIGPPTPGMEPLDAEAKAISEKESPKWIHPIESLPGQTFSQSLLADLQKQLADLAAAKSAEPAAPVPASGIKQEDFDALKQQVAELVALNAALLEDKAKPARRV